MSQTEKQPSQASRFLRFGFKVGLSILALWLVSRQIPLDRLGDLFLASNKWFLVLALIFFNLSQIVSAFRFQNFMKKQDILLSPLSNIKLYYFGMFYNLLLPGGIGGDAYKIYLLQKNYDSSVKDLTLTTLIDRGFGLLAILFFLLLIGGFLYSDYTIWLIAASLLFWPLSLWVFGLVFPGYKVYRFPGTLLSVSIQLLQLVSVVMIMMSLSIPDHFMAYPFVFLITSVALIVPVFWGGLGVRELIMSSFHETFGLDPEKAVMIGLLFFGITLVSSLWGGFLDREGLLEGR